MFLRKICVDRVVLSSELRPAAVYALQVYHNMLMADAVEGAYAATHPDIKPSGVGAGLTQIGLRIGFTTWSFDLRSLNQKQIKDIFNAAQEAVELRHELKNLAITPTSDSFLTTLIKQLRPATDWSMDTVSKQTLNLITQQYRF
jgi:hypothetical protein